MNTSDKYILSSLDNALTVLNLFVANEELSPSEISKLTEINRSTVFRFLVTLENRGYLTREENGKYRLGIKLFTLGQLSLQPDGAGFPDTFLSSKDYRKNR